MKKNLKLFMAIALLGFLVLGCSKKTAVVPTSSDAATTTTAETVQPVKSASVPALAQEQIPVNAQVSEAKTAINNKDYEKASAILFVPHNPKAPKAMTGQELEALNKTKSDYLSHLAAAAAAGDLQAKAAYEKLRQQAMQKR